MTTRSRVAAMALIAGILSIGPVGAAPPATKPQSSDSRLAEVLVAPVSAFFQHLLSALGLCSQPRSGAPCTGGGPCTGAPAPPPPDRLEEGCGLDPNGCPK